MIKKESCLQGSFFLIEFVLKEFQDYSITFGQIKNNKMISKKIAIQGYPGAFHQIAVNCFHDGNPHEIVPVDTFDQLVEMVEQGKDADGGMMAIENTIAGSLLNNYQLLNNSKLHIAGEVFLRIKQNLMALPGKKIEDLEEVHSHPIAIAQCRQFFKQYPSIKLIDTLDTALSAKLIRDKGLENIGAIASTLAADLYEMDILAESIETNKQNFTRFLALEKGNAPRNSDRENKISICFSLPHEVGSLYKVMGVLVDNEANLTKIQSVPLIGSDFKYLFFIDFEMTKKTHLIQTLGAIRQITLGLKVLGQYQKGNYYDR